MLKITGKSVKKFRKANNLTTRQMGEITDLSYTAILDIEQNQNEDMRLSTFISLYKVIGGEKFMNKDKIKIILSKINKKINALRVEQSLRNCDFANKIKVHPSYASRIKTGHLNPLLTNFITIAKALKVKPEALLDV